MAGVLQHLRSSTLDKRPNPASMVDGQVAINYASGAPGMFFKDSNGSLVKVGPVHVGTTAPNASPASGGTAGNSRGEQWLDTTGGTYVFKIWDGSAWRSESGTFVDTSGDTMTGALGIIAGSASTPGLFFSGDTNTGIYSPGADQVAISTGGSGRLFVTSTGQVLTGTASTTADSTLILQGNATNSAGAGALQLNRGTISTAITSGSQLGVLRFSSSDDKQGGGIAAITDGTWSSTSYPTTFTVSTVPSGSTASSERLRITSAGLVGVGTSSPDAKLEVVDTASSLTYPIAVSNFTDPATDVGSAIDFRLTTGGNSRGYIACRYTGNSSTDGTYLSFAPNDGSTGNVERMRITKAGLVGVGTTPVVDLDVAPAASTATFRIHARSNTTPVAAIELVRGTNTTFGADGSGDYRIKNDTGNLSFEYGDTGVTTERLRITSAGLVGIGTTSADTALSINGDGSLGSLSGAAPAITLKNVNSTNYNASAIVNRDSGGNIGCGISFRNDGHGASGYSALLFFTRNVGVVRNTLTIGSNGTTEFNSSASTSPAIFKINDSEVSRIDGSGRLLVGTSTNLTSDNLQVAGSIGLSAQVGAANFYGYNNANVNGPTARFFRSRSATIGTNAVVLNGDVVGVLDFRGADGTNFINAATIACEVDGTPGTNDMPGRLVFSTCPDSSASPVERLRINQAGGTYAVSTDSIVIALSSTQAAGTTNYLIDGKYSGTAGSVASGTRSFRVFTNGNVENTNNSYTGLSDIKLKENIVDANSQWNDLKALQVRNYNFKEGQTHAQIGLVAQEVELVSPGLVSESPDRDAEGNDLGTVTKSVNYSVLYMKAVKALQEAMARIEQLESEMAAVKAQLS